MSDLHLIMIQFLTKIVKFYQKKTPKRNPLSFDKGFLLGGRFLIFVDVFSNNLSKQYEYSKSMLQYSLEIQVLESLIF